MIDFSDPQQRKVWCMALNTYTRQIVEALDIERPRGGSADETKDFGGRGYTNLSEA